MKRKQVMALFAAGILTFQMPISVMAEIQINETPYTDTGSEYDSNESGKEISGGVRVTDGDQLVIKGDVSGKYKSKDGIDAMGDGTSVTVTKGNVVGYDNGIYTDNKATISVNGDIEGQHAGVKAENDGVANVIGNVKSPAGSGVEARGENTKVDITGTVWGGDRGVYAEDKATVNVKGNVTGNLLVGAEAQEGSSVHVTGDIQGKLGAYASGKSKIEVAGNIVGTARYGAAADAYGSVYVNGNVKGEEAGVRAQSNGTVSVKGDVNGTNDGVLATNPGATVKIDGNVRGYKNNGVYADNDAEVSVTGNVEGNVDGVIAMFNSKVSVNGNVSGTLEGAAATDGAEIQINGDVKGGSLGVQALDGGRLIISGSLEGGNHGGAYVSGDEAFLYVGGNVKSEDGQAIIMSAGTFGSKGSIVEVLGVVDGKIVVESKSGDTVEDALGKLGNVIVNEIKTDGTKAADVITVKGNDAISSALVEKVAEQKVFYIVNTEKIQNGTITIMQTSDMMGVMNADGSNMLDAYGNKLYAANQNKEITVKIVADQGYRVKSADGGKATLVLQADGTYLLTVPAGGGVDISALIEKIAEKESKKKSSKKTSGSGNAAVQAGETQEIMYVPVLTQEADKTAAVEATELTEQIESLYYGDIITAVMKSDMPVAPEVPVVYAAGIMDEQLVIIDQEAFTDDVEELKLNIARELVDEMELEELKDIQFVIDSHVITVETEKLALIQDQYGCKKIVIHVTKNEDGSLNNEVTIDITSMIELDMVTE